MNDKDKEEKQKISLVMPGGTFPAFIDPKDEEIVRKAALLVNQRFGNQREKWKEIPKEQVMTAIAYKATLDNLRYETMNDTKPFADEIKRLTALLEDYLRNND